jgi:hypothetical protein
MLALDFMKRLHKKGRPPKFSPELMEAAAKVGPQSRHGRHDRLYATRAKLCLKERYAEDDERRSWLFNEETAKWSLLAELGRLLEQQGEEAFLEAAGWIMTHQPKVKVAVRAIRSMRTGRLPREDGPGQT